jgi:precorrin-2 dehydrogenase/sirohydrochlorin ferrochelatase
VLDPALSEGQRAELETAPNVRAVPRRAERGDIEGRALVFAATDSPDENSRIAALCASLNVLCNVADAPGAGSFHVPATAEVRGLLAAFSTGGQSPALARRIKQEAGVWLETRYAPLLAVMGRLRPLVFGLGLPAGENAKLFRSVAHSRLDAALARRDEKRARAILLSLLPAALHGHIEELLHEPC